MAGHTWREEPDGFRYLYIDYRGAGPGEALAVLLGATEVLRETLDARVVIEVDGSTVDREWMAAAKRSSHEVFGPNRAVAATIGIHTLGRVLLRGMNAVGGGGRIMPFPDLARALAWLRTV